MVEWTLTRQTQIHRTDYNLFIVLVEYDRNGNEGNENGNKIDVGLAHTHHYHQYRNRSFN